MPLPAQTKSPHRHGRKRNTAEVNPFLVWRALKAGISGRDRIARTTGVPSNVVSRIINSRGWHNLGGDLVQVEVPDLTEEMA